MEEEHRKLTSGIFSSLFGGVVARGANLISMMACGKLLGAEEYGKLVLVQGVAIMASSIGGYWISVTATRSIAAYLCNDEGRAGRVVQVARALALCAAVALTLILAASGRWLARDVLHAPSLATLLYWGGPLLAFTVINLVEIGIASGHEAFTVIAKANLVSGALSLPSVAIGTVFWGIPGALCGFALSQLANGATLRLLLCRVTSHPRRYTPRMLMEVKEFFSFGIPAAMSNSIVGPVNWCCQVIVLRASPLGFAEVGVFGIAYQLRMALAYVPLMISNVLMPMLSRIRQGRTQTQTHSRLIKQALTTNVLLAMLPASLVIAFATELMSIQGKGFASGGRVVQLLSASTIFVAFNAVLLGAIASMGSGWALLGANTVWGLVMITLTFAFRTSGAQGLALANLIAFATQSLFVTFTALILLSRQRADLISTDHVELKRA